MVYISKIEKFIACNIPERNLTPEHPNSTLMLQYEEAYHHHTVQCFALVQK